MFLQSSSLGLRGGKRQIPDTLKILRRVRRALVARYELQRHSFQTSQRLFFVKAIPKKAKVSGLAFCLRGEIDQEIELMATVGRFLEKFTARTFFDAFVPIAMPPRENPVSRIGKPRPLLTQLQEGRTVSSQQYHSGHFADGLAVLKVRARRDGHAR